MRKIQEVLRLHHACELSKRKIAPLVGIGPTAVGDYIRRAWEADELCGNVGDGIWSGCGVIAGGFDAVGDFDAFDDLWQLVLAIQLSP